MAEVIRKGSAAEDVIADVHKTLVNARARGGAWVGPAEEKLGLIERLWAMAESRHAAAMTALAPLLAALNAEDDKADDLLGATSDDVWNKVGRPGSDPILSIMFPGGIAYYTDARDEDQPDRMDLLAELLEAGLHPKLEAPVAHTHATAIRASAGRYREKVEAVRAPAARVKLLEAMKTAVGRYAQTELSNLKRRYKSDGLSESDIHTVIPAHTRAAAEKTVTNPVNPPVNPSNPNGGGHTP